mmetsp:Transcript_18797/g.50538  ORF Transcript_18797/g.50538 Transcript_18797/m.50538 type:complete len:231 (-) Transcript_18797:1483-2175(-)
MVDDNVQQRSPLGIVVVYVFVAHIVTEPHAHGVRDGVHVLVTTAAEVEEHNLVGRQAFCELHGVVERVRGLEGGDDALGAAQGLEALERLLIRDRYVIRAQRVLEPGVLGTDTRVVEACGDGVGLRDLPHLVLQEVGARAVEDAGRASGESGGMTLGVDAVAPSLHANELDRLILHEGVEHADGVGAAPHARHHVIGQAAGVLLNLGTRLLANDSLEVAHDRREGVRTNR